jgi:hypothetical protein
MTVGTTQALARVRIRRWHHVGSGWLVVEPEKLVVYRRRFMSPPEEVGSFETERLRTAGPDAATNSVSVTFEVPQGEPTCETFSFSDRRDVETVASVLSGLVNAADEERRRRIEEAAQLDRAAEEHRRQVRQEFAAAVWRTAEALWSLVKAGYSMQNAVIAADWVEARKQYSMVWQQADRLKDAHEIDLMVPLKELDEMMCSENGEAAMRKAGSLLRALGDKVLQTEAFWAKWRKDEIVPSAMSPNWNHLPYFLLFSQGHFETILSSQIEDWAGVSNGLSVLHSSVAVIRQCFKVDMDGLIDAAESAGLARNVALLAGITGRIEGVLTSSFETRPFEYQDPVRQPGGGRDGFLPE